MKQRTITAVGYVIVLLGLLFLKWLFPEYGSVGFDVLFWAISFIGAFEFMRAVKEISKAQWWTTMITCVLIVPTFVITKLVVSYFSSPEKGSEAALMMLMTVASVGAMVTASLMVFDFERSSIKSTAFSIFCIIYCGVLGCVGANINHMVINSLPAIMLMFFLTAGVDTFAFLTGKLLGKKFPLKLAPHTSPNKTVVGAIGGIVGGIVAAVVTYFICVNLPVSPFAPSDYVIFEYNGKLHPCVLLILIAIPTSIFAQLGDLFESAIKRGCGIKDMGKLLPGHGGMLDRFDSMLFSAVAIVVLFIMVR
jgi:phosphatidate cytidylyltransferase